MNINLYYHCHSQAIASEHMIFFYVLRTKPQQEDPLMLGRIGPTMISLTWMMHDDAKLHERRENEVGDENDHPCQSRGHFPKLSTLPPTPMAVLPKRISPKCIVVVWWTSATQNLGFYPSVFHVFLVLCQTTLSLTSSWPFGTNRVETQCWISLRWNQPIWGASVI